MPSPRTALLLGALLGAAHAGLLLSPRDDSSSSDETDYINSVCSPDISGSDSSTIPPCISVTTIEAACYPNGTEPLDYLASAECLCDAPSTFFADWQGCQRCLYVHGARTERDLDTYAAILSSASAALCTGTPTAEFAAIFSSVAADVAPATSGSTVLSDLYPSETAVSLYYTASSSQGPGVITGSATEATATAAASGGSAQASGTTAGTTAAGAFLSTQASYSGESTVSRSSKTGSATAAATTGSSSSSTSASGAGPTAAARLGAMAALAGGVVAAAAL